jgi:hypothetical protein
MSQTYLFEYIHVLESHGGDISCSFHYYFIVLWYFLRNSKDHYIGNPLKHGKNWLFSDFLRLKLFLDVSGIIK